MGIPASAMFEVVDSFFGVCTSSWRVLHEQATHLILIAQDVLPSSFSNTVPGTFCKFDLSVSPKSVVVFEMTAVFHENGKLRLI